MILKAANPDYKDHYSGLIV
jgi:hypothetical protein